MSKPGAIPDPSASLASGTERRWILRATAPEDLAAFREEPACAGLPEPILAVLARHLDSPEEAAHHLEPLLQNLSEPFDLPDMRRAVDRLFKAIDDGEKIVLYGDYDVDGVTSCSLMRELLSAYGSVPGILLPDREAEGYGLTEAGLERCLRDHPDTDLLIAIDCGTNSWNEIASLVARGIEVLVLDHHETSAEKMADCTAVVNPKRHDCDQTYGYLCSVGIVFKVAHALLKERQLEGFDLRERLDLVAFGTIADIVPLVGENRILVKRGLDRMEKTRRPGILALREVAGIKPEAIRRASSIGFGLGPRINAAGRLGDAADALELLLSDDLEVAKSSARVLDALNSERKQIQEDILTEAIEIAEAQLAAEDAPAIVVGRPGWHIGVVGIVAASVARRFHRPAIVVGFDEGGRGKGSGRSVPGFSLVAALDASREHLIGGGGHEQAVGVTVAEDSFETFRSAFIEAVSATITPEQLEPRLYLDAELPLAELDLDFLAHLDRLEPFGASNPEPLFLVRDVRPGCEPRRLKDKHFKLQICQGISRLEAIYFNADPDLPEPPWDVAFSAEQNHYKGRTTVQMQVRAIRAAAEIEVGRGGRP